MKISELADKAPDQFSQVGAANFMDSYGYDRKADVLKVVELLSAHPSGLTKAKLRTLTCFGISRTQVAATLGVRARLMTTLRVNSATHYFTIEHAVARAAVLQVERAAKVKLRVTARYEERRKNGELSSFGLISDPPDWLFVQRTISAATAPALKLGPSSVFDYANSLLDSKPPLDNCTTV